MYILVFETGLLCSFGACPGTISCRPTRLALNAQRFACFCLPSAGIKACATIAQHLLKILFTCVCVECMMLAYVQMHMCACEYGGLRLMVGVILGHSFTLFFEAGSYNQTQSSLIWLLLPLALLCLVRLDINRSLSRGTRQVKR